MARTVLSYLFAVLLGLGALGHVVNPEFYAPMVPAPIPLVLANVLSTVVEGALALLIIWPATRRWGVIGFTALMVAFMPIHLWDLVRETPAVGSHAAAWVRLALQILLIGLGAWVARLSPRPSEG
ncbi:MAG: hypothetical protein AAFU79_33825 [Myxococcota bacterium]